VNQNQPQGLKIDNQKGRFPPNFGSFWPSGFRGEDFFNKFTNQKQESPMMAMLFNGSE
jgi:hypothetical protein